MAIADEEIKKKIVDQLYSNARIDSSKIKIFVEDGVVTLSGTVPNFMSRQTASNTAWTVSGVSHVDNLIKVELPPNGILSQDQEIASRIESVLEWNPELEASDISVSVKNGCVTLGGSVDVYWKKFLAEESAANIKGVFEITNKLSVVPTKSMVDESIANEITEALDRHVEIESGTVGVKVEKGLVTLLGTVSNWAAKNAAFMTAVYTDGVTYVDNRLAVKQP